jgi:hypothetical protein
MINVKKVKQEVDIIESITCDKCKETTLMDSDDGQLSIQEFHHINFIGGYGSPFGDMSKIKADICGGCLKVIIGDFCSIEQ